MGCHCCFVWFRWPGYVTSELVQGWEVTGLTALSRV